jgi:hypothetical protein
MAARNMRLNTDLEELHHRDASKRSNCDISHANKLVLHNWCCESLWADHHIDEIPISTAFSRSVIIHYPGPALTEVRAATPQGTVKIPLPKHNRTLLVQLEYTSTEKKICFATHFTNQKIQISSMSLRFTTNYFPHIHNHNLSSDKAFLTL